MPADSFGLCPLVFDGVEIRGIGWEVFEGVAGLAKGVLNVGAFVEGGVIHDDHGGRWQLWEENLVDPGEEDLGVDAGFKQTDGQELQTQEGADDVGTTLGVPIPASLSNFLCKCGFG